MINQTSGSSGALQSECKSGLNLAFCVFNMQLPSVNMNYYEAL